VDPACQRQFSLAHALPLSLAAQWGQPVGASFLRPFALSLYLSLCLVGPVRQCRAIAPARPLFSLCALGLPCQFRLLHARCGPMHANSHTSPGFSAMTPAHAPSSFFRAPPVPRAQPSPHFARLHPLSRSAHTTSRRRRPTPAFPAIQLAGDRSKPPRAPPRGETPVPVPNFPYCALCSSNFAFVGARPRWSTVLARWPADLARPGSPE
jgi:hypothetical protein